MSSTTQSSAADLSPLLRPVTPALRAPPKGCQRVTGAVGQVETHPHVALRGQMVDIVWPHLAYDVRKIARTADVAVVQMQLHRVAVVGVPVDVVQPVGVEAAGPAQDAVYLVAFGQ